MPAIGNELPAAGKDFERVQLSRLNAIAVAINAHALRCEPDPDQRCYAEKSIRERCSSGGVNRIYNVEVDGDVFRLHSHTAAECFFWLILLDRGGKICTVPFCLVQTGPAAHRRHLCLLFPWKRTPPAPSELRRHGGKLDRFL